MAAGEKTVTRGMVVKRRIERKLSSAVRARYCDRYLSQRGRIMPIAMANRNQILRIMCHIFAA